MYVGRPLNMSGYSTRSDKRYKRDVQPLEGEGLKDRFMRLRPVQYYLRHEPKIADDPDRLRFGFIANEVEALFPNLVINAGLPDTVARGLEYDGFIPILVKVVQEQERRLAALEQENAELRLRLAELETLRARLEALEAGAAGAPSEKRP